MKAYITVRFTYSQTKLKNSFVKVKNKNCQKIAIHKHTAVVFLNVQYTKYSNVDIMKATLERSSKQIRSDLVWKIFLIPQYYI